MQENQWLRDESIEPSSEVIAQGLGLANNAYVCFLEKLTDHGIVLNWRYYHDGKSWLGKGLYQWTTIRGTQKETTAFWLSIWEGFFRIVLYIPEKCRAEVANLPLGDEVREKIADAKQIGKLKFFPLIFDFCSEDSFDDVFVLIDFRKAIK